MDELEPAGTAVTEDDWSAARSRNKRTAYLSCVIGVIVGPLVGLFVAPGDAAPLAAPVDYEGARTIAGGDTYARFFHAMLRRGVALAPGAYEVMFPGMAHDEDVLARVVEAAGEAAAEVSG